MAYYYFKARDQDGRAIHDRIEAANERDLEARLLSSGIYLVRCRVERPSAIRMRFSRVSRQDLVTFFFHMEQSWNSGISIIDALSDLRDSSEKSGWRTMLASLTSDIMDGTPLHTAMGKFPAVFNTVVISLVEAGEVSGELGKIFANLSEYYKWVDEMTAKTKKAFQYPLILAVLMMAMVVFVMSYIIPKLVQFFTMMSIDLPTHTRLLIGTSKFFVEYWPFIGGGALLLGTLFFFAPIVSPTFAYIIDFVKIKMFIFGPLRKKIILARFSNIFSIMFASGINIIDTLNINKELTGNRVMEKAISEAKQLVQEGNSLTESLKKCGIFPPLILRMVSLVESS